MYKTKYLKYKNKYLTLKDQYGGSSGSNDSNPILSSLPKTTAKRLEKEAKNNNFNIIEYIEPTLKIKKDNKMYNVTFNLTKTRINVYPFIPPLSVSYNSMALEITPANEWAPTITISDIIDNNKEIIERADNTRVLIYCHDGKDSRCNFDEGTLTNHWWGTTKQLHDGKELPIFEHLMNAIPKEYKLKGETNCDTLDNDCKRQPTVLVDGFDNEIISNLPNYDLVIVPDCGGEWFELQSPYFGKTPDELTRMPNITKDTQRLVNICKNLRTLLTPKGIIIFSKFMSLPFLTELEKKQDTIFPDTIFNKIKIGNTDYVIVINK